jgi:hypothetical protein
MPVKLRNKLIQMHKNAVRMAELNREVTKILEDYNLSDEIFIASANLPFEEQTEALSYINYGEGTIESNLEEFENIFLLHVNRAKNE